MAIQYGPLQTILSDGKLPTNSSTYIIGVSDSGITTFADVVNNGLPITGTMGARLVAFRLASIRTGQTTTVQADVRVSWTGTVVATAAIQGSNQTTLTINPSSAVTLSNFEAAASSTRGLVGVITPTVGPVIGVPALHFIVANGAAAVTGLTIEARVGYEVSGPYVTDAHLVWS